ncbi:MAG: 4Fe-4S binding protein [Planctomycetes bacterium]|nr:4Fe-4S binding protein [Planctomycetota bacterium]
MRELPVLNPTRCTGCGECVSICPVDCLAMSGKIPWLSKPDVCVACTACVAICPTEAIVMRPLRPA